MIELGYVHIVYSPFMFSRERKVTFHALSGPRPDGGAPSHNEETGIAEMISATDRLSIKDGDSYVEMTDNKEVDGESGEGLLRVLQTDTQGDKSMIHVRCGFTGQKYTFVIPRENFIPERELRGIIKEPAIIK